MLSRRDPWVNLLRATIGCFAAAVGGADAITVLPFDSALGLPDDLGRRMARNTQAILHDESSLARVIDAAGGSWYVETLTDQLAEKAWSTFVAIERAGGALAALDNGTIVGVLAPARAARAADIAHRRAPLTGVSEYAFVAEEPVVREPAPTVPANGPLPVVRWAETSNGCVIAATPRRRRPAVFLAAIGPVAAYTARVGFASNLFQAGGIEPIVGSGTPDDMVDEFVASGDAGRMPVLVGSRVRRDGGLGGKGTARSRCRARLAGWRRESRRSRPCLGIDGYVYAGCDAVDGPGAAPSSSWG